MLVIFSLNAGLKILSCLLLLTYVLPLFLFINSLRIVHQIRVCVFVLTGESQLVTGCVSVVHTHTFTLIHKDTEKEIISCIQPWNIEMQLWISAIESIYYTSQRTKYQVRKLSRCNKSLTKSSISVHAHKTRR